MDLIDMIQAVLDKVRYNKMDRADLEGERYKISCYKVEEKLIRIDIKEVKE